MVQGTGSTSFHQEALHLAEGNAEASAWLWQRRGRTLSPATAALAYQKALDEFTMADLLRARLLRQRGVSAYQAGQLDPAEAYCSEAWNLSHRLAPGGVGEIRSAVVLAKVALNRGQPAAAVSRFEELRHLAAKLDPVGRLHAEVLSELGIGLWLLGDLGAAEARQREALEIYDRLGVRDPAHGYVSMGLGMVLSDRGELAQARRHYQSALEVFEEEETATPSLVAWSLESQGLVAHDLGDYDTAERLLRRALAIFQSVPARWDMATSLKNLGRIDEARGDLSSAIQHYREALDIFERHYPNADEKAQIQGHLGDLQAQRGEFVRARELLDRALIWYADHAPGGLFEANALVQRGRLAQRTGDSAAAEGLYLRALGIRRRLAPGSAQEAEALYALGSLRREQGRREDARRLLQAAVAALEVQKTRLGGSMDDASTFAARHAPIYRELIEVLLELDEPEAAFGVLEGYRAQGLLALLAARDLLLDDQLPAELARRRRDLARAYDKTQEQLAALDDGAAAGEAQDLVSRLRDLRRNRAELDAELLQQSPRLADLISPRPLSVAEAAAALDPGTLLLSYAVLPGESYLFVLGAGGDAGVEVWPLGLGEEALRREIEAFLLLMRSPQAPAARPALLRRSQELYRRLVAPVETRLSEAQRVLVVPDGPLHALPFGALASAASDPVHRYLIAQKPLHTAVSVTVYARLRARRAHSSVPDRILAFGDPAYPEPAEASGAPESRLSLDTLRAQSLRPLPSARTEVEALSRLFPDAETYLGDAATEERFKSLAGQARYLHSPVTAPSTTGSPSTPISPCRCPMARTRPRTASSRRGRSSSSSVSTPTWSRSPPARPVSVRSWGARG